MQIKLSTKELQDYATPSFCTFYKDYYFEGDNFDAEYRTYVLENYKWTHLNIWDCPYEFMAEKIVLERALLKNIVLIRCEFTGLAITNTAGVDILPVKYGWGHPDVITYDQTVKCNYFVVEKGFDNEQESKEYFEGDDVDFTNVMNDIIADG